MSLARVLLSACAAAVVAAGGTQPRPAPPAAARSTLRVGMWTLWRDREILLTPSADTILATCIGCEKRALAHPAAIRTNEENALTVTAGKNTERVKRVQTSGGITLTAHSESVTLRDPVTITARNGTLVIAVTMPIERYVERVVASESGPADTLESLKALTVVVRSYALHEAHGHPDYDLCDSTHCQLLHWHGNERSPAAHAATLATAGETLWYRGQRAAAYFSKDCGGQTAAAAEIWPRMRSAPFLNSHPDKYCTRENSEWSSELTRAELTTALNAHGIAAPGWQHLAIDRRGESGRVVMLRLDQKQVPAEDFRIAIGESLGWNKIPSTWFEVNQQGEHFLFHGRGTGHGVGLCQKGAAIMTAQGSSASEILAQYFPGAAAADENSGREWVVFSRAGLTLETLHAEDGAFLPELVRARAEASERSGLNPGANFTVRAFASTHAFRDATLAPGWMAGFAEGNWIACQPLGILSSRGLLVPTLRHEFVHGLVEHEAGSRSPLWLREGLSEFWSSDPGAQAALRRHVPITSLDAIDPALSHAATEAQSGAAHRDAAIYAACLLDRYGREQVLAWLRSGVPANALASIGQR